MVNFGASLKNSLDATYASKTIDYEGLKELLFKVYGSVGSPQEEPLDEASVHQMSNPEAVFEQRFVVEASKADVFFHNKLAELRQNLDVLVHQCEQDRDIRQKSSLPDEQLDIMEEQQEQQAFISGQDHDGTDLIAAYKSPQCDSFAETESKASLFQRVSTGSMRSQGSSRQASVSSHKERGERQRQQRQAKAEKRQLKRSGQSLKRAMMQLHSDSLRLDSFRALTYTACIKILKKHDKLAAVQRSGDQRQRAPEAAPALSPGPTPIPPNTTAEATGNHYNSQEDEEQRDGNPLVCPLLPQSSSVDQPLDEASAGGPILTSLDRASVGESWFSATDKPSRDKTRLSSWERASAGETSLAAVDTESAGDSRLSCAETASRLTDLDRASHGKSSLAALDEASINKPGFSGFDGASDGSPRHAGLQKRLMAWVATLSFAVDGQDDSKVDPLQQLREEIVALFAERFCGGDIKAARGDLILDRSDSQAFSSGFGLGLRSGIAALLVVWMLWDCFIDPARKVKMWSMPVIYVFEATAHLLVLGWLWGISTWLWSSAGINFLLIFELSPRDVLDTPSALSEAATGSAIWIASFILYYKAERGQAEHFTSDASKVIPPLLFVAVLLYGIFPWHRRKYWWQVLLHVVTSPFGRVGFRENFVADVLTSLVAVLREIGYSMCYLTTAMFVTERHFDDDETMDRFAAHCQDTLAMTILTNAVALLPLTWRLLQCLRRYVLSGDAWPHLYNALKYFLSISVVVVTIYKASTPTTEAEIVLTGFWYVLYSASTLYSFWWDVWVDWALFPRDRLSFELRRERMLSRFLSSSGYYFFAGLDLVLRALWTLSLVDNMKTPLGGNLQQILSPLLASAEMFRRCVWGCFRLENEHLHNSSGYRRVDFIPLHFGSLASAQQPNSSAEAAKRRLQRTRSKLVVLLLVLAVFGLLVLISTGGRV